MLKQHPIQILASGSGIVIAVPIPAQFEGDGEDIERAIQTALAEAKSQNISGTHRFLLNSSYFT